MIFISLTNCPPRLRGDLSKWLNEINTGVYVGNVSARVREELWERICENCGNGQATMVFPVSTEQGFDFRTHNSLWEPVDYDGIKIMRIPLPSKSTLKLSPKDIPSNAGFSNAAIYSQSRKAQIQKNIRDNYVILNVVTTGNSHLSDEILEIAALKIINNKPSEEFQILIRNTNAIPNDVQKETGITEDILKTRGEDAKDALNKLLLFIENFPIVCYNASHDWNFIQATCKKEYLPAPRSPCEDIYAIAKRKLKSVADYRLETVAAELNIDNINNNNSALNKCHTIYKVRLKLAENRLEEK